MSRRVQPLAERFWSFVPATPPDECWQWFGSKDRQGYARINRGRREEGTTRAHRVSWELHGGPIPPGMLVVHSCSTRECTNPRHLKLGTMSDAMAGAFERGQIRRRYGLRSSRGKLSDEDVALMRALAQRGWQQSRIAARFDVAPQTVQGIVSGRRRSSLTATAPALADAA